MRGKLASWQISDAEVDKYVNQIKESHEDVRQAKIDELPITLRPLHILLSKFETVGDMMDCERPLLCLRGFGKTSLAEVQDVLARLGLELRNQYGGSE